MKRILNLAVSVFAAAAFSGSLFAASNVLKVHVPFDFVAAGKKLPAGDYTVVESDAQTAVILRGAGAGHSVALITYPVNNIPAYGADAVRFDLIGGEKVLSELSLEDGTHRIVTKSASSHKWTGGGSGGH